MELLNEVYDTLMDLINNTNNEIDRNSSTNNSQDSSTLNSSQDNRSTNNGNESGFNGNDMTTNTTTKTSLARIQNTSNEFHQNDQRVLINIAQINANLIYLWKIRALVTCEYPKRTFTNTHGDGEISSWDLTDESGSITLIAFNLNSYIMGDKLKKDKAYEFSNLTIRPASEAYKTLPHKYQLVCTNATSVQEINDLLNHHVISYNFTHLNQVNNIPLNSIIDVEVRILRDFGISTGVKNDNIWSRHDLHVDQDGIKIGMTLWNTQARFIDRNMFGLKIKAKYVKVSWFDGPRILMSMGNSLLRIV